MAKFEVIGIVIIEMPSMVLVDAESEKDVPEAAIRIVRESVTVPEKSTTLFEITRINRYEVQ